MKQQMKKDDIFSDLEDDISRSWGDIESDIKLKRKEEEKKAEVDYLKNNPTIFNAPSFKRFYEVLVEIYKSGGRDINSLHKLLASIFYNHHKEKMPNSFNNVWRIFCSPQEYECSTNIRCGVCHKNFDIMFKIDNPIRGRMYYDGDEFNGDEFNNRVNISRVHCPICGYHIFNITGKLMGIFESESDKEMKKTKNYYMEERGYDFREEFGVNF